MSTILSKSEVVSKVAPYIRWMIRADMDEVAQIEQDSFEFPWFREEFERVLRQRNAIGMVAEYKEQVVGYMIYELNKSFLHILNFAVSPYSKRIGIGTAMMTKLIGKLSNQRRIRIDTNIRETNLAA